MELPAYMKHMFFETEEEKYFDVGEHVVCVEDHFVYSFEYNQINVPAGYELVAAKSHGNRSYLYWVNNRPVNAIVFHNNHYHENTCPFFGKPVEYEKEINKTKVK